MEFLQHIDIRLVFLTLHIFGVVLAAGVAFFSDYLFMTVVKDGKINEEEFSLLEHADDIIWGGLFLVIPSGIGLFALAPDFWLANSTFLAKTSILAILIFNGILFRFYHIPQLKKLIGQVVFDPESTVERDGSLIVSGAVSVVSWIFILILGSMIHVPFGYALIMLGYLAAILFALLVASKVAKPIMDARERKALKKDAIIVAVILLLGTVAAGRLGAWKISVTSVDDQSIEEVLLEEADKVLAFSALEVAEHATADDCWIIIDDLVFDMADASKLHPAAFPNCGGDATENYFKSHAPSRVIRDKQMAFFIGGLEGVNGVLVSDDIGLTGPNIPEECAVADRPGDATEPRKELFVKAGSWDAKDLMIVIEKHCRSLIFIDGNTHQAIGRIHDIGHQMHAPTVSNDGKFMYIVARDGIASKVNLTTLEIEAWVTVGENSRGTGLTDDGKYLLIGNFEPHTAVLIDTVTFKVVKEYKIETTLNGEEITSRVGGVAQLGTKLYLAIKDANQVWVIDTAEEGFPVVAKYMDMGQRDGVTTPPLHDIYLTPDGKYLIAAVQDAAVAWVLDTESGEVVAEVPTGKTPHTGPGATVGDLTFVPTLDEAGIISVINTKTWTNVMDIKTGGPSLFIRHNPTAETAEEYGYVWGEAAFGDRHDEIYLINLDWVEKGKSNPIEYTLKPVPGESSWHPEFTSDGKFVYIVSMTGNQIVVYDADTFEVVARIKSGTPSSVINVGSRMHEAGL